MTTARRPGFGLSRELWLIQAGIFLNMLGYGAVLPFEVIYLHDGRADPGDDAQPERLVRAVDVLHLVGQQHLQRPDVPEEQAHVRQ